MTSKNVPVSIFKDMESANRVTQIFNEEMMNGSITLALRWYQITDFKNGYARVKREDGYYNLIDENGNLFFKEWFLEISSGDYPRVKHRNGQYNFVDIHKKEFLSKMWFDRADCWIDVIAAVQPNLNENKHYLLDMNGNLTLIP